MIKIWVGLDRKSGIEGEDCGKNKREFERIWGDREELIDSNGVLFRNIRGELDRSFDSIEWRDEYTIRLNSIINSIMYE